MHNSLPFTSKHFLLECATTSVKRKSESGEIDSKESNQSKTLFSSVKMNVKVCLNELKTIERDLEQKNKCFKLHYLRVEIYKV